MNNIYFFRIHKFKKEIWGATSFLVTEKRYKEGTIKNLIHRTFKISSTQEIFSDSVKQLKQTFINNGFSNRKFDIIFNNYLAKSSQQ